MALKRFSTTTLLLSVAVFAYLLLLVWPDMQKMTGASIWGKPAPEFHFELPELGPTTLREFRGKVVLLNFWAEWCVPCLEEMPSLKLLEKQLASSKFAVIAVNVEGEKAKGVVEVMGKQLPQYTVLKFRDKELDAFGVQALPYSVLVDAEGVVRKVYLGSRDWVQPKVFEEIRSLIPSP